MVGEGSNKCGDQCIRKPAKAEFPEGEHTIGQSDLEACLSGEPTVSLQAWGKRHKLMIMKITTWTM